MTLSSPPPLYCAEWQFRVLTISFRMAENSIIFVILNSMKLYVIDCLGEPSPRDEHYKAIKRYKYILAIVGYV